MPRWVMHSMLEQVESSTTECRQGFKSAMEAQMVPAGEGQIISCCSQCPASRCSPQNSQEPFLVLGFRV